MKLTHYYIHPLLKGHIEKLWAFECEQQVPADDLRVIVPNGLVKIVIPFRNGLKATLKERNIVSPANEVTLIGISDVPSVVVDQFNGPSGTIGIEFSPSGAYRFFNLSLEEIKNRVIPLSEVLGKSAESLQELIANTDHVTGKIKIIQQYLLEQFAMRQGDEIFEYCVRKIIDTQGVIQVGQLEKLTGYSSRWLNIKFHDRIGISPKNLCSIIRFQQIYRSWAKSGFTSFDGVDLYEYYHDQAHFIKDFKRFTGYSPTRFQAHDNDFGRIFYKG
ncbi:MAG TPA: helix-turn-helix domain-containing protein [Chryseosolibacter sp.]